MRNFLHLRADLWLPLGIGMAALLLYATSAAPGIVELFDDTLEFQIVGPTFGIAHPTGYPLYILLSGVWSRLLLPVGEWAWRMNLFSAVCGAATVGITAHLGARLAPLPRPWNQFSGLAAALAFGLGAVWWSQTTVAEVYALHMLFVALTLAQTLAILDAGADQTADPPQASQHNIQVRRVAQLCLLLGLGLAHHRTTALLLPSIGLLLLWQQPALLRPRRAWFTWLGALLLPLLLYLWLPLRATQGARDLHGSYTNTWRGFWDHVLARDYMAFFSENPLMVSRTPSDWLALAVAQLGVPALLLAGIGLLLFPLLRAQMSPLRQSHDAPGWALIGLTLATNLGFAYFYRVGDVEVFLLPAFLCAALLAGLGLGTLLHLLLGSPPAIRHSVA
ncbi:MAG: DUF2723 domain-containing protein, partial [Litorilinea sp.]